MALFLTLADWSFILSQPHFNKDLLLQYYIKLKKIIYTKYYDKNSPGIVFPSHNSANTPSTLALL